MKELLFLQALNFIADYPLQGEFLATMKAKNLYLLFVHCFIWTGVVCIGLEILGVFAIWKFIFLLSGHFLIDLIKAKAKNKERSLALYLWIDQLAHFCQIIFVYFL